MQAWRCSDARQIKKPPALCQRLNLKPKQLQNTNQPIRESISPSEMPRIIYTQAKMKAIKFKSVKIKLLTVC